MAKQIYRKTTSNKIRQQRIPSAQRVELGTFQLGEQNGFKYFVSTGKSQDNNYKSTGSRAGRSVRLVKVTRRAKSKSIPVAQASREITK